MREYGYCRISTKKQSIERQIRNIKELYPKAIIISEAYTGTKINRPEWNKLLKKISSGDTIIFDSVSRMSRNSDDGIKVYFYLLEKGINLVFLKEPYINTEIYKNNAQDKIELMGTDEDEIFKGINNYFRKLAKKQIKIAFDQAEKEVTDLRQRTKEGLETARLNGKQIGLKKGSTFETKKSIASKKEIKRLNNDFDGYLSNEDTIKLLGISRKTFYKYKKELRSITD